MATVRVYYSRTDQDYDDYNLYVVPGIQSGNVETNTVALFPDFDEPELGKYLGMYPWEKHSFTIENNLGYVDIETNNATNFGVYIKRKDYQHTYNRDSCTEAEYNVCMYCNVTGYVWHIETLSGSTFYLQENSGYVYKDTNYNVLLPQRFEYSYDTNQTTYHDSGLVDEPVNDDGSGHLPEGEHELIKNNAAYILTYAKDLYYDVVIPESHHNLVKTFQDSGTELSFDELYMLYLKGKTFDIGENMQLSLSQSALDTVKAAAIVELEELIAGALYKLSEDIEAFDDAAFLAGFDDYKAARLHQAGTCDGLKAYLEAKAALE